MGLGRVGRLVTGNIEDVLVKKDLRLLVAVEDLMYCGEDALRDLWQLVPDRGLFSRPFRPQIPDFLDHMQRTLAYLDRDNLFGEPGIDWEQWGVIEDLETSAAHLGDYGYVEVYKNHHISEFVRLGHITDLLQDNPYYADHPGIYSRSSDLVPSMRFKLPLHCPTKFAHEISLAPWCMKVFWDHVLDLAALHGIPAYRIVIVNEKHFNAGIINRCGDWARCSTDRVHVVPSGMSAYDNSLRRRITCVYHEECTTASGPPSSGRDVVDAFFHCIIPDEDLTKPSPSQWGYWSFIDEPSLAPWPNVNQFDRIFAACSSIYRFRRLSRVEIEFYTYCVQVRTGVYKEIPVAPNVQKND